MIAMIALAKYTLIVDSGLTFTLFVYCWPISEDHTLYCAQSRSVRPGNVGELLCSIESSHLCEGLSYLPEVKDVALDPTRIEYQGQFFDILYLNSSLMMKQCMV